MISENSGMNYYRDTFSEKGCFLEKGRPPKTRLARGKKLRFAEFLVFFLPKDNINYNKK